MISFSDYASDIFNSAHPSRGRKLHYHKKNWEISTAETNNLFKSPTVQ